MPESGCIQLADEDIRSKVYLTRKLSKTLGLDGTTCSYNLNEEDEEIERAALMTFDLRVFSGKGEQGSCRRA